MSIHFGATFSSTQQLKVTLKEFEESTKCSFVFKNSVKSETDNKRRKSSIDAEKFELCRGTITCAHYGNKRKHSSKGVKASTSSQKLQCGASFSFRYDDIRQCLVVSKCNLEHNHLVNSSTFAQQHKQKKLTPEERSVLRDIVALNPDNNKLMHMVQNGFGKALSLKDIRALKNQFRVIQKLAEYAPNLDRIKRRTDMANHPLHHFQLCSVIPCVARYSSCPELPKKDVSAPLDKTHNPKTVEDGWYEWWLQQEYFSPHDSKSKDKFVVLFPPPNVTASLHLGHALTSSIQDAFVRWNRMSGKATLWVPGTDHAGIATHAVVERKIWKETGKTRHDLGKDAFVSEIWNFKHRNRDFITEQLRRLGLSFDWSREYFTLSEDLSESVTEAFCRLYEKGLIYQERRLVNWSCAFRSSVSDIEVDKIKLDKPTKLRIPGEDDEVEFGVISSFAYPVINSDEKMTIATTRLETMMADVAVAVHPDDQRYRHLVGKCVQHPIIEGRQLPIIADSFVDKDFATGVVKLTPGHDYTDFEVGRRHGLDVVEMLEDDGRLNPQLALVGGMTRFQARRKLKEVLGLMGLFHGDAEHSTVLPLCSRSGDVIEPRLKRQWFLDCRGMAEKALEAVETDKLMFIPDYNRKIWKEWLSDAQDWCLSRQLWWGHQIPVYTHKDSDESVCARTEDEARQYIATKLGLDKNNVQLSQDEDVLDTWFSSALLPFSSLGWPTKTPDLGAYFPQQLMETGQDILFFWVARMVMLSLELTGELPFDKVLLHGMVRDSHGRKMSKSLGNVIDPLDVIDGVSLEDLHARLESGNLDPREVEKVKEGQRKDFPNGISACGADALRLTLCSYNVKNMDINFNVEHADSKRKFCNKVWQSFKFISHHLGNDYKPNSHFQLTGSECGTDIWILSRLSHMVQSCDQYFKSYDLHNATIALQMFWHLELCDVYLESVKPVFASSDVERQQTARQILHLCVDTFLRAMAPFMPFVCEELYQRLPHCHGGKADSVCIAQYPKPEMYPWCNEEIEASMSMIQEIVSHVQKLRKDYNMMGSKSQAFVQCDNDRVAKWLLDDHKDSFTALSRSGNVSVLAGSEPHPPNCAMSHVQPGLIVYVELKGARIEKDKELSRLLKKCKKLEEQMEKAVKKLDKLEGKGRGHLKEAVSLKEQVASIQMQTKDIVDKMETIKNISL